MNFKEKKIGFAIALFEIAKEEKKIKKIYKESKIIYQSLEENGDFIEILNDFSLQNDQKKKIVNNIYKNIDIDLLNTMYILIDNNAFRYIIDVLEKLISFLQNELNIKEGIVYSTTKISDDKIKKLEKKLSNEYNVKISLKNHIDKELIGGFKIIIDDIVIEDSIKSDLEDIKHNLLLNKGEY